MKLHHLKPAPGAHRKRTRKGRGEAAGKGKTAGRGTKGTGARGTMRIGFEGGQTPLQQRLPKLPGFTSRNRVEYATVNVGRLADTFEDGAEIGPDQLRDAGLIRRGSAPVKVLGDGELSIALVVSAHAFSASAERKITEAGGRTETMSRHASADTSS
jgi:large subunit ribosomal protein L15